jgi:hypothetical protein
MVCSGVSYGDNFIRYSIANYCKAQRKGCRFRVRQDANIEPDFARGEYHVGNEILKIGFQK